MSREQQGRDGDQRDRGSAEGAAGGLGPTKLTITEQLSSTYVGPPVQGKLSPGKRSLVQQTFGVGTGGSPEASLGFDSSSPAGGQGGGSDVQRRATTAAQSPTSVHEAAAQGVATPSSALPYASTIERAFGRHNVSSIQAHQGPAATASAQAMGAQAYATGDHVVLGGSPDLHTVAHEAAHVVQQRGGVQLKGGVGETGDAYERHADAVADAVVAGQSAEALLDAGGANGGAASHAVQRKEGKDDASLLGHQASLKGTDVEIPALEGALLSTRKTAVQLGLLSPASFDAGLALSRTMTQLQPSVAAKGAIDPITRELAATAAMQLYGSLLHETRDDKNFQFVPSTDESPDVTTHNPYTDETRVTTSFLVWSTTHSYAGYAQQLPVLIRSGKWEEAFRCYRQLLDGLDLWVADQLRKKGKGTPEEALGNAHQHYAQLRTGLEQIADKHATRLPALFHPDAATVAKERAAGRPSADTVPMNVYFWKDAKDGKFHIYDLTTPSRPHEQAIDAQPNLTNMATFFEEVARYPEGEVRYTLPSGASGVAPTTGKTKWYEWAAYAGLALVAVGFAVLSAGASIPATVCFAAGALAGGVSAAGHLVDTARLGTATTSSVVLDVAQIVASFASAGAMNITLKAGSAAAALAGSRWFVPLVTISATSDGVQLVALTDITVSELTKIKNGAGSPEDKQRAMSVLLTQLIVMGGLTALSVRGARDARALAGKPLEVIEQNGAKVLRVAGEATPEPVPHPETKAHPTEPEPAPHAETNGKPPINEHEPTAGPPKTTEGHGNAKPTEGGAKTPEVAAAEARQAKIDAALEAELKAHGLDHDPMFKDMDPQTRGKVSTALKNDPLAKASDGVQDAALRWAKDGAEGNPREFANRYEYARAKFSEIRSRLAPEYNGKPNGKNLLNTAAGKELSPERLAKDLAVDNATAKAHGPGENLDMSKLPEKPSPDDIGRAVKRSDRFGFESETADSYHAVKHQEEMPAPKLSESPVENYNAYAKDTIKTGDVVKAESQPNGSTLIIVQKTYGDKLLEAILYIRPDGTVTLASYGQAKAVKGR